MEVMLQDNGCGNSRVSTAEGHMKSTEPDFGKVNLMELTIKKMSNRSHRRRRVGCDNLRGAGEVSAGDLVFLWLFRFGLWRSRSSGSDGMGMFRHICNRVRSKKAIQIFLVMSCQDLFLYAFSLCLVA